mmetsp:Transcript_91215/g.142385  ORF Transcript_91215/g.142385 Transcript_91215/m.142385 type:complete len:369 (-) Transcript_91215:279-1385(-)
MVLTRSMMKKRSRQSFYMLDMSSGTSSVFIRNTKDSHGNTQREVIDLRKAAGEQQHSGKKLKRSSVLFALRFMRHRRSRGSSLWQSQCNQPMVEETPQQELQNSKQLVMGEKLQQEWHAPSQIAVGEKHPNQFVLGEGSQQENEQPNQLVLEEKPQQEFHSISMPWWLRTFRGVENQVAREVRQMIALQLGLFEQFKQWGDDDRRQLLMSLPVAIGTLEMIHSQTGALLAWIKRLQAILEQESLEKIQRQTGALVGWAQHLHAILEQEPVDVLGTSRAIDEAGKKEGKLSGAPVVRPMAVDDVKVLPSECGLEDTPLSSVSLVHADNEPPRLEKVPCVPALVDPLMCASVAIPPYIRRSRSRGLSLVR